MCSYGALLSRQQPTLPIDGPCYGPCRVNEVPFWRLQQSRLDAQPRSPGDPRRVWAATLHVQQDRQFLKCMSTIELQQDHWPLVQTGCCGGQQLHRPWRGGCNVVAEFDFSVPLIRLFVATGIVATAKSR